MSVKTRKTCWTGAATWFDTVTVAIGSLLLKRAPIVSPQCVCQGKRAFFGREPA
jgi:hypothetical protein